MERIVFVGDIFRPADWANVGVVRLSDCLLPAITAATSCPGHVILTGETHGLEQTSLYDALELPFTPATWIGLYTGSLSLNEAVAAILRPLFLAALVVGFELPAALVRWLSSEGVTVIDLAVCPLQFMEDLALSVRANDPAIFARLMRYNLEGATIQTMAGIAKATLRSAPPPPEAELNDVVVFCMSTPTDRMLTIGDRYASFRDFEREVGEICSAHEHILIKPHPWGGIAEEDAALFSQFPHARRTTTNVYQLLSQVPGLKRLVSLISSASLEAPFFGVPGTNLLRQPVDMARGEDDDYAIGRYATVLHDVWTASFWSEVLGSLCRAPARLPRDLHPVAHRLRSVLNMHAPVWPIYGAPTARGRPFGDRGDGAAVARLTVGGAGAGVAPVTIAADMGLIEEWGNLDAPRDQKFTGVYVDNAGTTLFQTVSDDHAFGQNVLGWTRSGVQAEAVLAFADVVPAADTTHRNGTPERAWSNTYSSLVTLGSHTVATLPQGSCGMTAYCTDARLEGEGPDAGSGSHVTHNGKTWKVTGTNIDAVA